MIFGLEQGRGTSAETCGLDDVFPPDDVSSLAPVQKLCVNIYIYIYAFLIWVLL